MGGRAACPGSEAQRRRAPWQKQHFWHKETWAMRSSEGGAATSPPPGPEGERQLHWDPCWLSCRCPPPPATPPRWALGAGGGGAGAHLWAGR